MCIQRRPGLKPRVKGETVANSSFNVTRRQFFVASGVASAAFALGSCTSQGSPSALQPLAPVPLSDENIDRTFVSQLVKYNNDSVIASTDDVGTFLAGLPNARSTVRELKRLCASYFSDGGKLSDDPKLVTSIADRLSSHLQQLQRPSGLYDAGNNLESPPDSAFSLVDIVTILRLIQEYDRNDDLGLTRDRMNELGPSLATAIASANGGGVHTANHRWEITGALYSALSLWEISSVRKRAEEWVAEGFDVYQDGFFSERSTQYDSEVVNPSLLRLAKFGGFEDALDLVRRNLRLKLDLIDVDGLVETVQSRRQDQWSLRDDWWYLLQFREFALLDDDGEFAFAADRIEQRKVPETGIFLAEVMAEPAIGQLLPTVREPEEAHVVDLRSSAGLLVLNTQEAERAVVFGGTDYKDHPAIASGLSTNPTFFKYRKGKALLSSLRLSPRFFSMGPLRPEITEFDGQGRIGLTASKHTGYYLPMAKKQRREDGLYTLADDGRFYSSMDFSSRDMHEVSLKSDIEISRSGDGYAISVETDSPETLMVGQLNFAGDGKLGFSGKSEALDTPSPDGLRVSILKSGTVSYMVGSDTIEVEIEGIEDLGDISFDSGEEYSYLNGFIPSVGDQQVLFAARIPGSFEITIG